MNVRVDKGIVMKVTIEIDDKTLNHIDILGYEVISYGIPKVDDMCYDMHDGSIFSGRNNYPYLIVKPKFVWPKWLKCRWIAKWPDGKWYALSGSKPYPLLNGWVIEHDSKITYIMSEISDVVDTSFFPDVPWQDSLRENPNYGKNTN